MRVRVQKKGIEIANVEIDPAPLASATKHDGLDDLFGGPSAAALRPAGRPLLDQVEDRKVNMPYGCRSGTCGSCRVKVLKGGELLEPPAPIEQDTVETFGFGSETRLACRAIVKVTAQGELLVELPGEQ